MVKRNQGICLRRMAKKRDIWVKLPRRNMKEDLGLKHYKILRRQLLASASKHKGLHWLNGYCFIVDTMVSYQRETFSKASEHKPTGVMVWATFPPAA